MVWLIWAVMGGVLANGLRMRRRVTGLSTLSASKGSLDGFTAVTATDADVPAPVLQAAAEHARRGGIGMLDLVPSDLPVEQALDLVRHVDPRSYRGQWFGLGRGAGYTVLLETGAFQRAKTSLERSDIPLPGSAEPTGLDAGEMGETTGRLRFYVKSADMVVAPFHAVDRTGQRRAWLRSLALSLPPSVALPQTSYFAGAAYLLVLSSLLIDVRWGLGLVLLYCLSPYIVFARTPLAPADLHLAAWTRPVATPLSIWRTLRAPRTRWERRLLDRRERAREWYWKEIEAGVERFQGERCTECPWCGSAELTRHVVTRDVILGKPGRFPLDRCKQCGHIFQNPRLTPDGLDFYYRDAYDGLNEQTTELILSSTNSDYLARARMVQRLGTPYRWLDVGTGKGHFCRVARTVLPETAFDGLDMGTGVEEAVRRGWIDRAYNGQFFDLGPEMAGRYDVISMNHYLEHTADPLAELDLAAKVLAPEGLFLLEMPDPESPFAKLLRTFYLPYLPPQHLHLIPIGNLERALRERGMEVVAVHRREARRGGDLGGGAACLINLIGVDLEHPWRSPHRPGVRQYARITAGQLVGLPLLTAATVLDLLIMPFRRGSNTYRILARKVPAA
ncbi:MULTISPECIES: class I SAM-dependent methyltransferase [unclassified Spirillospora]|uniref:class I SAM-dependent methyltransferase n=1 Tax=unclassified Spirillospora TaxID=2642701 RepID=UPI00371721E9